MSAVRCDVSVLGPVLVSGTGPEASAPPLVRTIVGLLAVAGDAGLSDTAMAGLVWGTGTVPASRRNVAVHRTREWLDRRTGGRVRVERTTTGYVLRGAEVDAHRFTELLREDEPGEAGLMAALALWRGAPLADAAALGPLEPLIAPLRERHRDAVLRYTAILIESGRVPAAVDLLTPVAEEAVLDEQVHALLLRALAASGRQAEALLRYERLRHRLADELGVDPGPELADAMLRVLRGELAGPRKERPAPAVIRPAQLTPDVRSFTGRGSHLSALDVLADAPGNGPRVALVTGVGGVGKTALAVHWAHSRAAGFPDGQLHIDLRGYSPGRPISASEALGRFLRALGVAPSALPSDLDESATLFRSLTARRRMLVVLDNAAEVAQVRPLLPGDAGVMVLVTSRDRLDGLVVRDGASRIVLDVLDPAESLALLSATAGAERIAAEPGAAAELARLSGQLPLALRVIAAHLTAQPDLLVTEYVNSLASNRIPGLAVSGDPTSSVHEVFDQSYRRLAPDTRRMYRLLGLAPGADITARAAAVLVGTTAAAARRSLEALVDAHLVALDADRYVMHDLISEHARGRADADEAPADAEAAVRALEDWYYDTARLCCRALWPNLARLPGDTDPDVPRPPDPHEWLAAEAVNLIAVIGHAADRGRHDYVWRAVLDTRAVFDFRDSATALLAAARIGLASAMAVQDWYGIAALAKIVGTTCLRTGLIAESPAHYRTAIDAAERVGWRWGKVSVLTDLAIWHGSSGELARANEILREVVANCVTPDMHYLRATAYGNMATAYRLMGDLPAAARHARLSLAAYRRLDATEGFLASLLELGVVQYEMGRFAQARGTLLLVRWAPSSSSRLDTLCGSEDWLARVECAVGNLDGAAAHATESTKLAEDSNDQERITNAHATLGLIALAHNDQGTALLRFRESAGLAVAAGDPAGEAAALAGLAMAYLRLGDIDQAEVHADAALAIGNDHGYLLVQSDAHRLLAISHHDRGRIAAARAHAERSLAAAGASEHRARSARTLLDDADLTPRNP